MPEDTVQLLAGQTPVWYDKPLVPHLSTQKLIKVAMASNHIHYIQAHTPSGHKRLCGCMQGKLDQWERQEDRVKY